jgi:adenylate cyclase
MTAKEMTVEILTPTSEKSKIQHLEMLMNVSRQVAAHGTLDAVLHEITKAATEQTTSERGSLFLYDAQTKELYSRVALGEQFREIRVMADEGVVGFVFNSGEGAIINNAYEDARFNKTVDQETGFKTEKILCVPIRTPRGEIIGVVQTLNKQVGEFDEIDLHILESLTAQCAVTLQATQNIERMEVTRAKEMEFMDVVSDITSEIDLGSVLQKVMLESTRMLDADRATLFLNDSKSNELFSKVAMGDSLGEIRLPNHAGIAGAVFTSKKTVNIPYAYADMRFNPAFDKQTGYFTRSILCVPVVNKRGETIGVTQVLNKRNGTFNHEDESRLKAFTAQVSIALENAKLFDDVQRIKNYNESMLQSMSNGVITMDDTGGIVTCNAAILKITDSIEEDVIGKLAEDYFGVENQWVMDRLTKVRETGTTDMSVDTKLIFNGKDVSANVTILPLLSNEEHKKLGSMIMIEDISSEKRMKSTMSRYMDPGVADQLLAGDADVLGGLALESTVLFSDIRGFTTLTEQLGAQGTVSLLNEYFTIMVDCISREGGMLDKFIGDALMAGFGVPIAHDDDEDRAMRAAISMMTELREWNEGRTKAGLVAVDMGIGINTDLVVTGNIGSPKRMDYTMIGDGVNLAARLESACKQYAAKILISENTKVKLHGTYRMRAVDTVIVKGKTKPVAIYEVLDGYSAEEFPEVMDVVGYFTAGIEHYRNMDWNKAISSFKKALRANPKDQLTHSYIERCVYFMENPPGDTWNGVWVLTSK